jgi:hypothetical protein
LPCLRARQPSPTLLRASPPYSAAEPPATIITRDSFDGIMMDTMNDLPASFGTVEAAVDLFAHADRAAEHRDRQIF